MHHAIALANIRDRLFVLYRGSVVVDALNSPNYLLTQKGWDVVVDPSLLDILERYSAFSQICWITMQHDELLMQANSMYYRLYYLQLGRYCLENFY